MYSTAEIKGGDNFSEERCTLEFSKEVINWQPLRADSADL